MQDLLTEALITISGRRNLNEGRVQWDKWDLADNIKDFLECPSPWNHKEELEEIAAAIIHHAPYAWSVRTFMEFMKDVNDPNSSKTLYEILKDKYSIDAPELKGVGDQLMHSGKGSGNPEQAEPQPEEEPEADAEPEQTQSEPQPQEQSGDEGEGQETTDAEEVLDIRSVGHHIERVVEDFFLDNDLSEPEIISLPVGSSIGPTGVGIFFDSEDLDRADMGGQGAHDMFDELCNGLDEELGDKCWLVARLAAPGDDSHAYGIIAFMRDMLEKAQIEQENAASSSRERGTTYELINSDGQNEQLEEAHRDDPEVVKLTKEIKDDAERLKELGISTQDITESENKDYFIVDIDSGDKFGPYTIYQAENKAQRYASTGLVVAVVDKDNKVIHGYDKHGKQIDPKK